MTIAITIMRILCRCEYCNVVIMVSWQRLWYAAWIAVQMELTVGYAHSASVLWSRPAPVSVDR